MPAPPRRSDRVATTDATPAASAGRRARRDSDFAAFLGRKHFANLDALRAISIIGVIWHHTSGLPGGFRGGGTGVDLFFAISGFLITSLLLREKLSTGRINLRNFSIRRSLRIFPLYYLILAVYVALTLLTQRGDPKGQYFLSHLPAFATYTSNWFVDLETGTSVTFSFAGSLATEEQFYAVWPPVVVLLCWLFWRRRRSALAPRRDDLPAAARSEGWSGSLLAPMAVVVATILVVLSVEPVKHHFGRRLHDKRRPCARARLRNRAPTSTAVCAANHQSVRPVVTTRMVATAREHNAKTVAHRSRRRYFCGQSSALAGPAR